MKMVEWLKLNVVILVLNGRCSRRTYGRNLFLFYWCFCRLLFMPYNFALKRKNRINKLGTRSSFIPALAVGPLNTPRRSFFGKWRKWLNAPALITCRYLTYWHIRFLQIQMEPVYCRFESCLPDQSI